MISNQINSNFLKDGNQDVVLLDVNSLFLFSKNSTQSLYEFINSIKNIKNNQNIIFINIIDNGLNRRMVNKFPQYKANRITSKENHDVGNINIWTRKNRFKVSIDRIHRVDRNFINHLTFYNTGESDFKIGYILKQIAANTLILPDRILTVANDKDMVLASIKSQILLKRIKKKCPYQFFFKNDIGYLEEFKSVFKLEKLMMNSISDYYYYLLLNGDQIDNVKQLLTEGQTIELLNYIYSKYGCYNLNIICEYIQTLKGSITIEDIKENAYLIDIFNSDTFTNSQKNSMDFLLNSFFKQNNIPIIRKDI